MSFFDAKIVTCGSQPLKNFTQLGLYQGSLPWIPPKIELLLILNKSEEA